MVSYVTIVAVQAHSLCQVFKPSKDGAVNMCKIIETWCKQSNCALDKASWLWSDASKHTVLRMRFDSPMLQYFGSSI